MSSLYWWVRDWERSVEKPEKNFFTMNMGSIVEYLLESIHEKKDIQKTSYDKQLLLLLQEAVTNQTIEADIIEKCKPNIIHALKQPIPEQPSVSSVHGYLKGINDIYNGKRIFQVIKKELFKVLNEPNKNSEVQFFTSMLTRLLLKRYSEDSLKKMPEQIFSKTFFSLYKKQITNNLNKSKTLKEDKIKLLEKILNDCKSNSLKISKNVSNFLHLLHYSYVLWESEMDFLVMKSREMFSTNTKVLEKITQNRYDSNSISKTLLSEANNMLEKVTKDCIFYTSKNVLFECLDDYIHYTIELSKDQFSIHYSDIVKQIVYKKKYPRYEEFNHLAADAFYWSFLETFSNEITKKIFQKYSKTGTAKLAELLSKYFHQEFNSTDEKNMAVITSEIFDKFEFRRIILKFTRELSSIIVDDILDFILKFQPNHFSKNFISSFSRKQMEEFFTLLSKDSAFTKVPETSKTITKKLINNLFNEFTHKKKHYRVISLVGGMDCNGKKFVIGDVTFYDPRVWEFGESSHFDIWPGAPISLSENFRSKFFVYETVIINDKTITRKRNSARVFVDVLAFDKSSAIKIATISIRKAIDTLVYASTAKTQLGFKAQLPIDFFVINKTLNFISSIRGPTPHQFTTLKINADYDKITHFYDNLIKNPPPFYPQLVKALDWYHRGHWATIAQEKFVLHWIGLEQLITQQLSGEGRKNQKLNILLEYVPKLIQYWHKGFASYGIGVYFSGITREITKGSKLEKFLESRNEFKGWKKNKLIILQHLDLLKPKTTGEAHKCVELIQKEFTKQDIDEYRTMVKVNRFEDKFKIAFLYSKRNSLIHEGETYSPELEIMANELERIFAEVIDVHLKYSYERNLKKIIYELNRPIHVK